MLRIGLPVLVTAFGVEGSNAIIGHIAHFDSHSIHVKLKKSDITSDILQKPIESHRLILESGKTAFEINVFLKEVKSNGMAIFHSGGAINQRQGRGAKRYRVYLSFSYSPFRENTEEYFSMPNSEVVLSESGAGFNTDIQLQPGELIEFSLSLPNASFPVLVVARVVYSRCLKFGCRTGVQFVEISPEDQQIFQEYLNTIDNTVASSEKELHSESDNYL